MLASGYEIEGHNTLAVVPRNGPAGVQITPQLQDKVFLN